MSPHNVGPTLAESIYAFTGNVGILRIYLNPYKMLKLNFDNNRTVFDNHQSKNYFLTTVGQLFLLPTKAFKKGLPGNICIANLNHSCHHQKCMGNTSYMMVL